MQQSNIRAMDIPTQEQLLAKIEAFCIRHEMAETRFGRDSVNNPAFIRGLREGKSPTLETLNKLSEFMERTDAEAETQAKLHALPPATAAEEEQPLPFSSAPVSPTGACSQTSSSTIERPLTPAASDSSHSSADEAAK